MKKNPFRYFKTSAEIIRLAVMVCPGQHSATIPSDLWRAMQEITFGNASDHPDGWRLPAGPLEGAIIRLVIGFLSDLNRLLSAVGMTGSSPNQMRTIKGRAKEVIESLSGRVFEDRHERIQLIVDRVQVSQEQVLIELSPERLSKMLGIDSTLEGAEPIILKIPCHLKRRGVETRLIIPSINDGAGEMDDGLIQLIAKARNWFKEMSDGSATSIREIARREKIDEGDVSRFIKFAFLAPDIVEAIVAGRQPLDLTVERLKRLPELPKCWTQQRQLLGI